MLHCSQHGAHFHTTCAIAARVLQQQSNPCSVQLRSLCSLASGKATCLPIPQSISDILSAVTDFACCDSHWHALSNLSPASCAFLLGYPLQATSMCVSATVAAARHAWHNRAQDCSRCCCPTCFKICITTSSGK